MVGHGESRQPKCLVTSWVYKIGGPSRHDVRPFGFTCRPTANSNHPNLEHPCVPVGVLVFKWGAPKLWTSVRTCQDLLKRYIGDFLPAAASLDRALKVFSKRALEPGSVLWHAGEDGRKQKKGTPKSWVVLLVGSSLGNP